MSFAVVKRLLGITPACAGNRIRTIDDIIEAEDHPRLRGEQALAFVPRVCVVGSPPLARGTAGLFAFRQIRTGITPACAGNSHSFAGQEYVSEDHPRGEQSKHIQCRICT